MPLLIMIPKWFSDSEIFYFWEEDNKILKTPAARSKLEKIPDACRIIIDGVSLSDVNDYVKELKKLGIKYKNIWLKNEKFTAFYKIEESEFAIIWENGEAKILLVKNPVCFVSALYLSIIKGKI